MSLLRARWPFALLIFFVASIVVVFYNRTSLVSPVGDPVGDVMEDDPPSVAPPHRLDPLFSVNGPPTERLYDNLKNGTGYVTSWGAAGMTNDIMTFANLIYIGLLTDRVPIIPRIGPDLAHFANGEKMQPIRFGEIFDLPRLRKTLGLPIIEWDDVKDLSSQEYDEIGCWSVWSVVSEDHNARVVRGLDFTKLDISWTTAPEDIILREKNNWFHVSFAGLAALSFPQTRRENLQAATPSPRNHVALPPSEQLLCFDFIYYAAAWQPFEILERDHSPAWRYVMQNMHWTKRLEQIARIYLFNTIGVLPDGTIHPYITIHQRRNDFGLKCNDVPIKDCYAPLSAIARRVEEVQKELREEKGLVVNHVIMTSDEMDPEWWNEVRNLGWFQIDHSSTAETYGNWFPPIIEAAIQSHSAGFVGNDGSTYSLAAIRRCESWHGCASRMVKWGRPGADDH